MLSRARILAVSIVAACSALIGSSTVAAASADTCTVTATNDQTGAVRSYQGVSIPAGDTDQQDLLTALVQGGFVPSGSIDLSVTTLTNGCASSTTTSTSTTSTSPTTSSSTSTSPTTSSSTSTSVPAPPPTTTAAPPSTPTSPTTSTTTSGSSTTTTRTTSTTTTTTTTTTRMPTIPAATTPTISLPGQTRTKSASSRTHRTHARTHTHTQKRTSHAAGHGAKSTGNPLLKGIENGSLTLDGTATTVPDFFIDSFQIPPFLLPIYQAAGIEYQVPWPVLAAINQIETDYGRDLSVSSAGAVGWMQFMPSTWKTYGVDATGNGVADPYNPVDAIFSAARYLHAAGASTNLARAILAYNHAGWYVQSVLLRAKLIAGVPGQLVNALSDLVEGRFPVAAQARYADDDVVASVHHRKRTTRASLAVNSDGSTGTAIFAHTGAPVIAVNDGKIVALGHSRTLGRYIRLQDATGNTYTYAHLGRISKLYASPKAVRISARDLRSELSVPKVKAPTLAASAGNQRSVRVSGTTITPTTDSARARHTRWASTTTSSSTSTTSTTSTTTSSTTSTPRAHARHHARSSSSAGAGSGVVKERLFAHPTRRASYAAGGRLQMHTASTITNFGNYFSDTTLHLARDQYTLRRLRVGSIVVAGTILGRIGGRSQGARPHLWFQIQPAGRRAPDIDPKPILDGWKLLQATDIYRARDVNAFYSSDSRNPSVGQVLLMTKQQLIERVLSDPHVHIYACGRRDIAAGLVDRRVLASLEFLADSGLHPTVSGLVCDAGSQGIDAAGNTGESADISAINGTPIAGHQGPGSITAEAIRRLLSLQGLMAPDNIVSNTAFHGQSTVLSLPDHANRIQISYTPYYGADRKQSQEADAYLKPRQWTQLINQIGSIPEPSVPITPSKYAIKR